MFLIYSPNGSNVCGSRTTEFDGSESVLGVESCKIVFPAGTLPIYLSGDFCYRMYRLACQIWGDGSLVRRFTGPKGRRVTSPNF